MAQLSYINSLTSLLILHVRLPLTLVYPTISSSCISHYLSLSGYEQVLLTPPYELFISLAHHLWTSRVPSMNMCHPCTLINRNLVLLFSWETLRYVILFWSSTIENSFIGPFAKITCVGNFNLDIFFMLFCKFCMGFAINCYLDKFWFDSKFLVKS